jgi:outer membrane protein TolC
MTVLSGCSPAWFARWADRDAYGTISEGQASALGKGYRFDIAYNPVDCDNYLRKAKDETESEVDVLSLEDALKVAFKNSRAFQTRKEALYSSALSLANLSRGWETVLPAGEVNSTGEMIRTNKGAPEGGVDSTNRYINGDGSYTLTRQLVGGGLLTLGASMNFATNFLGLSDSQAGSLVEGGLTQPLLRGAWRGLAHEPQHRRERDFLIDVYEFDRFRQTFAVDIMQKYYAVMTLKDRLENSRTNIERLRTAYLVTEAMVEGGELTRAQQDQAEQDLLNAQIALELTILAYSNALDNFKITLGLPISKDLKLDYPGALIRLNAKGPQALPLAELAATSTSFITDTALLRARATARDADKDVEIAADNFNPQLDLELKASAPGTDRAQPGRIQTHHHTRNAKLILNYNLDQIANRDAYRNAKITKSQSQRSLSQAEDTATLNVRNSFRSLKQSGRSFKLQEKSVEIAKRRTTLLAIQRKQGQATTRDVLEAEDALNNSLNGLTSSLVNYTITRLQFLASLGMLSVDSKGKLSELKTPFGYDRLQKRYPYLKSGKNKKGDAAAVDTKKAEKADPKEKNDD